MSNVIAFPASPNSLNDPHCAALRRLTCTLIGDWMCDIDADEDGSRYATLSPSDPSDPRGFVVIRERGRFHILDGHPERFGTVIKSATALDDILSTLRSTIECVPRPSIPVAPRS